MVRYGQSILEIANCTDEHVTTGQIFFTLKRKFPAVVVVIVHSGLNSLYQKGMIRKVSAESQPDRCNKNTRHDHLVCRRCGKLADLNLSDMAAGLEKQVGFKIDIYDLKIYYLCPECRKA